MVLGEGPYQLRAVNNGTYYTHSSSGVAAILRLGSQPIPSKLTDKIGEQATPTDPSNK
jgi:hypothetical protein